MKSNYLAFVFAFLFLVSCNDHQEQKSGPISGIWADSAGASFSNCYAVYSQKGDSIYIAHYLEFNGQSFFEKGKGVRKGDTLIYHVDVMKGIPGWSTAGDHRLILEGNHTLRGSYQDNKGNTGPIVLKRVD